MKGNERLIASDSFMEGLRSAKSLYHKGDAKGSNLSLCHGDLHPGSVMISTTASSPDDDAVKIIDPEFAIYGPPGVDVGSVISGLVLTAVYHKHKVIDSAEEEERKSSSLLEIKNFALTFINSYLSIVSARLTSPITSEIISTSLAFAACEVSRTALGFAGGRMIQIDDDDAKEAAIRDAVDASMTLMCERGGGVETLVEVFDGLLGGG